MFLAGTALSQPRTLVVVADSLTVTQDTLFIVQIPKDSEWGLTILGTHLTTTDATVQLKAGMKIKGYYRWTDYCCDMIDTLKTPPRTTIYFEDYMLSSDCMGIYVDIGTNTFIKLYAYLILQKKYN